MVHGEKVKEYKEGLHRAAESASRHQENEKTKWVTTTHSTLYAQES